MDFSTYHEKNFIRNTTARKNMQHCYKGILLEAS